MAQSIYCRIYDIVKKIPKGCVATYGQIAALSGNPNRSRVVGNALHHNSNPTEIPCHRVVSAEGKLAAAYAFGGKEAQAEQLKMEGVEVVNGKIDLKKFGWDGTDFGSGVL